jgi:putative transposase
MVTKCHEKVANARADFQHKRARTLIDENQYRYANGTVQLAE